MQSSPSECKVATSAPLLARVDGGSAFSPTFGATSPCSPCLITDARLALMASSDIHPRHSNASASIALDDSLAEPRVHKFEVHDYDVQPFINQGPAGAMSSKAITVVTWACV